MARNSYASKAALLGSAASQIGRFALRDMYSYGKTALRSRTRKGKTTNRYPKRKAALRPTRAVALSTAKTHQETIALTDRSHHVLYDHLLSDIQQGSDINNRERQKIFVKGVKCHFTTDMVSQGAASIVTTMRFAVLQMHHNENAYVANSFDANNNFFAGMNANSVTSFGIHTSGLQTLSLPINQRKWKILHEERLDFNSNSGYNQLQPKMRTEHRYVRVNKLVEFRNAASSACSNPLVFVWWYDNPKGTGDQTAVIAQDRFVFNVEFTDIL